MDSGYTVEIAQQRFRVTAERPECVASPPPADAYAPFVVQPTEHDLVVTCFDGPISLSDWTFILRSGPWSAYHGEPGLRIVTRTGRSDERCALTWLPNERRFDLQVENSGSVPPTPGPFFSYPLDFLATLLTLQDGLVLHACAAVIDGRAHVFVGPSGAGKSTVAHRLSAYGPILSDERVILRSDSRGFRAWGTPWPSRFGAALNRQAPVAALYLIEHGTRDRLTRLDPPILRERLFGCTSIPVFFPPAMDAHLQCVTELANSVVGYRCELTLDGSIPALLARQTSG